MDFQRHIWACLKQWRLKSKRKPLVLRGARQVGKTTLARQFAELYPHSIQLNLEREKDAAYFLQFTDAKTLTEALFLAHNIPWKHRSETLLFIDEIQESPHAIALLRYFYEDLPELHVMAAGSLLEHLLEGGKGFPVGRVEYLFVHPLNFGEYLHARQHSQVLEKFEDIPVPPQAHPLLLQLFKEYAIVGGMPEIVSDYLINLNLADLPQVYEGIWGTYKRDIEKYAANIAEARVIRHVLATAHLYVDQRIKFENFGRSNYRSREISEAMRKLHDARVLQLVYPTTDTEVPTKPNHKNPPEYSFSIRG